MLPNSYDTYPPDRTELSLFEISQGAAQKGIVYDAFYNKLSDPVNNLFTLEERGLTSDPSGVDPTLLKQASESADTIIKRSPAPYEPPLDPNAPSANSQDIVNAATTVKIGGTTYYIANNAVYTKFYSATLSTTIADRIALVRSQMLESDNAKTIYSDFEAVADDESLFRWRMGREEEAISQSSFFLGWYADLLADYESLLAQKQKIIDSLSQDNIVAAMQSQTSCIEPQPPTTPPAQTVSLLDSMVSTDPTNPNITKFCYWVKFCEIATTFGLTPMLDIYSTAQPSMRYWPIGMVVPSPAGLVKIPLPMIWTPLTVVSGSFGVFVLLLGICGVVPCPFVLMITNDGRKRFVFTLNHLVDPASSQAPFGSNGTEKRVLPDGSIVDKYPLMKTWSQISLKAFATTILDQLEAASYNYSVGSVQKLLDILFDKIMRDIYALPLPDMISYRTLKAGLMQEMAQTDPRAYEAMVAASPSTAKAILTALRNDIVSYIDKYLNFTPILFPFDMTAMDALELTDLTMQEMTTMLETNFSNPEFTFKRLISYAIGQIESTLLKYFPGVLSLNLNVTEDFNQFKSAIMGMISQAFNVVLDDPLFNFSLDLPAFDFSVYKCKGELGLNLGALMNEKSILLAALKQALLNSIESKITANDIIKFLGFNVISVANLPSVMRDYLMSKILINPDISMLTTNIAKAMSKVYAAVMPFMKAALSLTDALRALGITEQALISKLGIKVNVNILKTKMESLVQDAFDHDITSISNFIPDFEKSFMHFTPIMVKTALINFVTSKKTELQAEINDLAKLLMLKSELKVKGFSLNAFDLLDVLNYETVITDILDLMSGLFSPPMMPNSPIVQAMMKALASMPSLPYLATQAVCGFTPPPILDELESFQIHPIRALHPILNYDDIPPWERLDYSNFLFMVFLDQFCHKAKQTGGLTFLFGEAFGTEN